MSQQLEKQTLSIWKDLSPDKILKEQDSVKIRIALAHQLKSVALLFGIKDFSDEQSTLLATWVYDNYKYEQLSTVSRVLVNPPADKDSQWRLTPDTISRWMERALEKEAEAREYEWLKEKHKEYDYKATEMPAEVKKEFDAMMAKIEERKRPKLKYATKHLFEIKGVHIEAVDRAEAELIYELNKESL